MEPAVRLEDSGTIHDEWLLSDNEKLTAEKIRSSIAGASPKEALEKLAALLTNGIAENEKEE